MKIDGVNLQSRIISAPMAGVTDKAFRIIAREFFPGLLFAEMVNDRAVVQGNKRTREIFDFKGEVPPIGGQIFGSDPETMAAAARIVEEAGANVLDVNMGCPVTKVIKKDAGCALMLDPVRAEKIVFSVVNAVKVPVTVKMRKGWDEENVTCIELAERLEKAGASAVIIHGRTKEQYYKGRADWNIIRETVNSVGIPVIGNGDVFSGEDAVNMSEKTDCSGIMIGRGALGNPWIFEEVSRYLNEGNKPCPPTPAKRVDMAFKHLELLAKHKGDELALKQIRKHISWYLKGLKKVSQIREETCKARNLKEVETLLNNYKIFLLKRY